MFAFHSFFQKVLAHRLVIRLVVNQIDIFSDYFKFCQNVPRITLCQGQFSFNTKPLMLLGFLLIAQWLREVLYFGGVESEHLLAPLCALRICSVYNLCGSPLPSFVELHSMQVQIGIPPKTSGDPVQILEALCLYSQLPYV